MALLIRFLIFAALAWFGYRFVRQWLDSKSLPPASGNDPVKTAKPEAMQACAHCGVHVPVGESTQSRGKVFCSEAHRDSYFRDHPAN